MARRFGIGAVGFAGLAAVAAADAASTVEVQMTVFYGAVVLATTALGGRGLGTLVGVVAPLVDLAQESALVDRSQRGDPVLFFNTLAPVLVYLGIAWVVSALEDRAKRLAEARATIATANAELERSNAQLAEFAYVVAHDLREPMRTISSYAQLLARREGQLDEQALGWLERLGASARRSQSFIEELLAHARVGGIEGAPETVPLGAVVHEALANLDRAVRESEANVELRPLPTITGHRQLLVQLFQNLLSNALRYRGEAPLRVVVDSERLDGAWLVRVCDNGIGVPPERAEAVFDLFARGPEDRGGTGLGLSVVRRIAERHGGRVWVEPAEGGGSVFCVELPDPT